MGTMTNNCDSVLFAATAYVWLEADRLDYAEYDDWLAMWAPGARYIVPVEPGVTDFEAHLNYAYDDQSMRAKRVQRLLSGVSVSASPVPRTIRSLSRFRLISDDGAIVELRCMQHLTESRRGRERSYVANLEFRLKREDAGFLIQQKVVRLINANQALGGISYIL